MRRAPVSTSTPDRVGATTVLGWLEQPDAVTVIDVRSPAECETAHIAGSYNVPLDLLGEHAAQLAARLDREVVLVCQSGARAAQARERLAGVGAEHLHVLDGGVGAYAAAGGDIVRGRARWALERQVRLVAGARGRRRCGQLAGPGGESCWRAGSGPGWRSPRSPTFAPWRGCCLRCRTTVPPPAHRGRNPRPVDDRADDDVSIPCPLWGVPR